MADTQQTGGSMGSSLLVFLLGAAVGATVAVLYAPMSGEQTRAQIATKADELKSKASDLKDQVVDKASQLRTTAMSKTADVANRAADKMNQTAESARRVADTANTQAGALPDTPPPTL